VSTILQAISYRGALLSTLLHAIDYRGALLCTLLHAIVYVYAQFAECTVQIVNKMGFKKTNNQVSMVTGTDASADGVELCIGPLLPSKL
jgi:hypothetical protein